MARYNLPVAPRFWAKVNKSSDDDCWLWTGCKSKHGYGNICVEGRMTLATHVSLMLDGKPRQNMDCALHRCDTPSCVNPKHLFWGRHDDNMKDMARKGRSANKRGTANGRAKLNEKAAMEIKQSTMPLKVLASQYGVSMSTISRARLGKSWS